MSIGKSKLSKNSQGFIEEISSTSSGIQNPLDNTERFTSLNNFIIVNKPIVTQTSVASKASSKLQQPLFWYLNSALRAIALDSTKTNGSEFSSLPPASLLPKRSVEIEISVPIEPNKVTFFVKILLAQICPIILPSASLKINV